MKPKMQPKLLDIWGKKQQHINISNMQEKKRQTIQDNPDVGISKQER